MYFPVACGKCSVTSVVSDSLQPYEPGVAHQAPLSVAVPKQESWSGLPSPPRDLPHLWVKPACIASLSFTSLHHIPNLIYLGKGKPQKPFTQKIK